MIPQVSILIVSYGAEDMVFECLQSVIGGAGDGIVEIILVDNAADSEFCKAIRSRFPAVRLLPQTENLGFARGCNVAASVAKGEYLLLLNPDTVVLAGAIERLLAFARRRPDAGIWGGRTVFDNGSLNPMSCWRRPTLWGLFCSGLALDTRFPNSPIFNSYGYGGWRRDRERDVDVVAGCFLMIDKPLWDRLAGFSPEFFMYGEDADLCLRAKNLGYRPAVTPEATIVHHGSGTEFDQAKKIRQVLAARALLIRRHFGPLRRGIALGLLTLRPMLGRCWARPDLRGLWSEVWALRAQWLAGRF